MTDVNVEEVQKDLRIAREILTLVLLEVGPVTLDIAESKKILNDGHDRIIDTLFDADKGKWIVRVVAPSAEQ